MIAINIIGIDCATQSKKMGLALGAFNGGETRLKTVAAGTTHEALVATVARWLQEADAALLALDAPLGWPEPLGRTLVDHRAGERIDVPPNTLFRRHTDRLRAHRAPTAGRRRRPPTKDNRQHRNVNLNLEGSPKAYDQTQTR
jgi:predicted RNase H-like nuclease